MTLKAYINPDFTLGEKFIFFIIALVGILLCTFGARLVTRLVAGGRSSDKNELLIKADSNVELFYEMIISGTSVMSFAVSYVVCNHIYSLIQTSGESGAGWMLFYNIWSDGKDFALLLLICLSCVINTILDKIVIPLKVIDRDKKATVRMLSMFYVIIILVYLNIIGDESEYSPVMMYYLGLMIGRFVYFDASFKDFVTALKNMFVSLHLLIMGLILTGVLCYIGFSAGYLLERNYYIVGIFYTHLFMLIAVFVLHHGYTIFKMFRKPLQQNTRYQEAENTGNQYNNNQYNNNQYTNDQYNNAANSNSYNGNANRFAYYNDTDQDSNAYNGGLYYGSASTKKANRPSQNTRAVNDKSSQNMSLSNEGYPNNRPVNRDRNQKASYNKAQNMKMPNKANVNKNTSMGLNRNTNVAANRNTNVAINRNTNVPTNRNTNKHTSNNR
ncbi:Uncharacterized membrane protein [Butyrivibrio fibrisolvens]|uniref:Uncharacterized membrane protein n=1 Tax=Butyrivibrio fibrisolvens TaxID=831 RepID=A0A1H9SHE5_BUTFI|nr:hypothetical protein [Butyrivibrio fibrisolvens]SER84476.1 Uncharacterized membrane protein [Butyrivibrio fibrisolvens]